MDATALQNVRDRLAAEIRAEMRLPANVAHWTVTEREEYNRRFAAAIAEREHIFGPEESARVIGIATRPDLPPPQTRMGQFTESVGMGISEFGRQAHRLNPFREGNETLSRVERTAQLVAAVAIAGGLVYLVANLNRLRK